jgi:hypothetical protein
MAFVQKPFTSETLAAKLRQLLDVAWPRLDGAAVADTTPTRLSLGVMHKAYNAQGVTHASRASRHQDAGAGSTAPSASPAVPSVSSFAPLLATPKATSASISSRSASGRPSMDDA